MTKRLIALTLTVRTAVLVCKASPERATQCAKVCDYAVKSYPLRPCHSHLNAGFYTGFTRKERLSLLSQRIDQFSTFLLSSHLNSFGSLYILFFFSKNPDIDECSVDVSPCDENADCTNSAGSYSCSCKQGFTGDGSSCKGMLRNSSFFRYCLVNVIKMSIRYCVFHSGKRRPSG